MSQAATAPEINSCRSFSFLFQQAHWQCCAVRVWRSQRTTAMEHRVTGQRVRQVKNRSATELYYSGRFEEHYLQKVKSGSWCVTILLLETLRLTRASIDITLLRCRFDAFKPNKLR
jgi:hypothetical protein